MLSFHTKRKERMFYTFFFGTVIVEGAEIRDRCIASPGVGRSGGLMWHEIKTHGF